MGMPMHFAVYLAERPGFRDLGFHYYEIHAGDPEKFRQKIVSQYYEALAPNMRLVKTRKVPPRFVADILEHAPATDGVHNIGFIAYKIAGKAAEASHYHPKMELGDRTKQRMASGLGYWLERLVTKHLMKNFVVRKVRVGKGASKERKGQAAKVGVLPEQEVPLREWMSKLALGVRLSRRKLVKTSE